MSDPPPAGGGAAAANLAGRGGVALRAPLAAVTLLTTLPVPARAQARIGAREVAASAPFFPIVGGVLGLAVGLLGHLVAERSGTVLGGAVAVIALVLLTGALHLDGLADGADALGARGGSRARRLKIMRDSATGAYGTAAIAGWFVLVVAALAALPADVWAVLLAWSLGLARALAVAHAWTLPPARPSGLGAGFRMTTGALAAALLVATALGLGLAALPENFTALSGAAAGTLVFAAVGALIAFTVVLVLARRLLGGRTGDTLGASIALAEAAALFAAALAAG